VNSRDPDVSPIDVALTASRLNAVAAKMSNTLFRTGRSGVLNTARDFSCCIVDSAHNLVMAADSLPIHVMSGPDLISRWIEHHHPVRRRGDAFLHNSPYEGNSHAADHTIVVPVFDDDGRHRFSVLVKAHQADCGNSQPTTYMANAVDVYNEGALIFPAVQVQRDFVDIDDVLRMCMNRLRVPEQWRGDYLAMIGAARIGERALEDLGRDVGWDHFEAAANGWLDYAERLVRSTIARLPDGLGEADTMHDPFPGVPDGIPIRASVTIRGDEIDVDLSDNPDCVPCGLNLTEATARTAALIGVFNSLGPSLPANAGSLRPINVTLRTNCVAGVPTFPHSTSVATTNVADRVTNAVQLAFSSIADGLGMAEHGAPTPGSSAVISGTDPATGEPYINQLFLTITGGAAGPHHDGWLTICHAGNAGMLQRDSVELDESRFPIIVHRQELVADTEGAGRHTGAPIAIVQYGPRRGVLRALYAIDGAVVPAHGTLGGHDGGRAAHQVLRRNGERETPTATDGVELHPGDTLITVTGGGGGYGDPTQRDRDAVRTAVDEGLISPHRARTVYGLETEQP
jgi:N-methylhydantoinase B